MLGIRCSWFRLCTKCMDPSAVSAAMAVSLVPFDVNFSLTFGEFVPKTYRSPIISSGSLKLQSWASIRNAVINFSAVSDEPGKNMICFWTYVTPKTFVVCSLFLPSSSEMSHHVTTFVDIPSLLTDPDEQTAAVLLVCSAFERSCKHLLDALLETPPFFFGFFRVVAFRLHNRAFDPAQRNVSEVFGLSLTPCNSREL